MRARGRGSSTPGAAARYSAGLDGHARRGLVAEMPELPERQTERLHFGRNSAAGAVYFVTFSTAGRIPWLAAPAAAEAMLDALRVWHVEGDGSVLAATVMPDHVQVLFVLGQHLDVGRCVSRWKTVARRAAGYPGAWQRDFWERRVRASDSRDDYGRYVLLNPYRAGLVPAGAAWPWLWLPDRAAFAFAAALGPRGEPPEEWLTETDECFARLETGE